MKDGTTTSPDPVEGTSRDRQAKSTMVTPSEAAEVPPFLQRVGRDWLHLLTLNAFIIAQPMFLRLQTNPAFFTQEQIEGPAVWWGVLACLLTVPLVMMLLEGLASLVSETSRQRLHCLFVMAFFTLCAMLVLTTAKKEWNAVQDYSPGAVMLLVSIAAGTLMTWATQRFRPLRTTLTVASIGVVLFPVQFLISPTIQSVRNPPPIVKILGDKAENPAPIVMIVFDGFPGMSIVNSKHEVDAQRFPNFARLAAMSDWYRNASTVHARTDHAVPSLLSGRIPEEQFAPTISDYPQNLFTLLDSSDQYGLTVFEPFTRLCPTEYQQRNAPDSVRDQFWQLMQTVTHVYLDTTIPHDLLPSQVEIPRTWFGIPEFVSGIRERTTGHFRYGWDTDRHTQMEHFRDCLIPHARPQLYFLHVVLPHYPWNYLPSGRSYIYSSHADDLPLGTIDDFGEAWGIDPLGSQQSWQRFILQLKYADRMIGEILDKLEAVGMLDDVLLVVTGDHGVSFIPGQSSRTPSPQNYADLMSVPLFFKRPGQHSGTISDRNVESIDLLPSIAAVIGLPLKDPIDGESFLDPMVPARRNKQMRSASQPIVIQGDFPERFDCIERMSRHLPIDRSTDDLITPLLGDPQLIGRSIAELSVTKDWGPSFWLLHGGDKARGQYVPCLVEGEMKNEHPTEIAVVIEGKIVGTTRTYTDELASQRFSLLLPESLFVGDSPPLPRSESTVPSKDVDFTKPSPDNRPSKPYSVDLYEVLRDNQGITLRRCRPFYYN
ncbi:MAG: sulfatase-like hydrolase/transferase [Planctomycetaceae bacterium]